MSGEDREGEALTASALLARWESLRRPGEPERLPLEPGSAYEIDREGAVFRVSPPEPPKRLLPFDRKTAENRAASDWDFDPRRWRHHRERTERDWLPLRDLYRTVPPCAIVSGPAEDRWAAVVRLPSAAEERPLATADRPLGVRGPRAAWAAGGRLPAAGDTDRGWFLLRLPDGSSLLFHGPSKAAEVFGRYRESSAPRRGE